MAAENRRIRAHAMFMNVEQLMWMMRTLEAADFAEFCEHPDVIELDVVAASWYPEMEER
jgi:hypothetical protein